MKLIDWLIKCPIHWLINTLIDWLVNWFLHLLLYWLIDLSTDPLIERLIYSLSIVPTGCHSSMVDIAKPGPSPPTPRSNDVMKDTLTNTSDSPGSNAQVPLCIDDVTVASSGTDPPLAPSGDDVNKPAQPRSSTLAVETEKAKKNKRRRSWCNTVPGKDNSRQKTHKLAVMGRR